MWKTEQLQTAPNRRRRKKPKNEIHLDTFEVSFIINKSERTIRNYIYQNDFSNAFKMSIGWAIPVSDIRYWIESKYDERSRNRELMQNRLLEILLRDEVKTLGEKAQIL